MRKQILARAAVALAMSAAFAAMVWWPEARSRRIVTGAVLVADSDQQKQRPIADAEIYAVAGEASGRARSDQAGFFRLTLDAPVAREQRIILSVKHPGYESYQGQAGFSELQLVKLTPDQSQDQPAKPPDGTPPVSIANVRVRVAIAARRIQTISTHIVAGAFDGEHDAAAGAKGMRRAGHRLFERAEIAQGVGAHDQIELL